MFVWLHSASPPQHIANIEESRVATSDKLRVYMGQVNADRLTNLKWAGVFENDKGETRVDLFWNVEDARAYIARNDSPVISTEDDTCPAPPLSPKDYRAVLDILKE